MPLLTVKAPASHPRALRRGGGHLGRFAEEVGLHQPYGSSEQTHEGPSDSGLQVSGFTHSGKAFVGNGVRRFGVGLVDGLLHETPFES